MGVAAESLARSIGVRVRRERLAQAWTLDRLAETAGVSRRLVVNVEQGSANPSVGTLLRLSDALGVGLPALVAAPPTKIGAVTHRGEGAVLWTGDRGGRGVLVAGTGPPDVVELWDWFLEPGERHESESHTAGTRELLHVLAGAVTVDVDGHAHRLETGDAMTFPGDAPHAYTNARQDQARFVLTVFQPGVGRAQIGASR